MTKFVTVSLFIFIAIISGVAVVGFISRNNDSQPITANTGGANKQTGITGIGDTAASLTLSSAELAKHDSKQSCWLLISGKIYDLTSFAQKHPGSAEAIWFNCGKDGTTAFDTKGGNGSHSSSARAMLADYYIGDLNQTVITSSSNPTNPPIANPDGAAAKSRGEDEWEDD